MNNKGSRRMSQSLNTIMAGTSVSVCQQLWHGKDKSAKGSRFPTEITVQQLLMSEYANEETADVQGTMNDLRFKTRSMADFAEDDNIVAKVEEHGGLSNWTAARRDSNLASNTIQGAIMGRDKEDNIYRIHCNNSIFYNKLGRFVQIIDLFKLVGFKMS